jgi:adenylylsulfate kinase-like enzyme
MIIWLTGIPGVGKRPLADALKARLQNGRPIQILDAGDVRRFVNPSCAPPVEEQVATVAWIAKLLAINGIVTIVCCIAPFREQRICIRHKSIEEGVPFYEVWVDSDDIPEDILRRFHYEPPDPPDSRAKVVSNDKWDELAEEVIHELNL